MKRNNLILGIFGFVLVIYLTSAMAAPPDIPGHMHLKWLKFDKMPTISGYYGITSISLDELNADIASAGLAEVRIGGTEYALLDTVDRIIRFKSDYFSLANISNDLGSKAEANEFSLKQWKIGAEGDQGYGYLFGGSPEAASLVLYHSGGIHLSKISIEDYAANAIDSTRLVSFEDKWRFGQMMEAGAKMKITPLVSVDISYERSLVFPRFLVWKYAGSAAIEGIMQVALNEFVDKILKASPYAAPIVNFALKNASTYGLYELRKEKMNYPFKSYAPLVNDTFKMGLTFTF